MPEPVVTPPVAPTPAAPILGKFKDQAALEAAYTELEKKLGAPPDPVAPAPPEAPKVEPAATPAAPGFDTFEAEYVKNGKLSDESYKTLETKFNLPKDVVNDFIGYRHTVAEAYTKKVVEAVGGEQAYVQMMQWASKAFTEQEVKDFNAAVKTGDFNTASIALGTLKTRYEQANGRDPKLLGGNTSGGSSGGLVPFDNPRQAAAFKSKPGFDNDVDLQREYRARLVISNF